MAATIPGSRSAALGFGLVNREASGAAAAGGAVTPAWLQMGETSSDEFRGFAKWVCLVWRKTSYFCAFSFDFP